MRHRVTPVEVEEVFYRNPVARSDESAQGEERFLAYGITGEGRLVTVVYTERDRKVRPITGWDMTRPEKREYEKQIL